MSIRTWIDRWAPAGLFLAALSGGSSLFAAPVTMLTPGGAFSPEGPAAQVNVENIGSGRSFRGKAFAKVTLRANLRMPSSNLAELKLQRIAIHFRTSAGGPSLRSVELRNGSNVAFAIRTDLTGDFTARDTTQPDFAANTWVYESAPIAVSAQSVVRLEVQFPGGFDSVVDPGQFVLTDVSVQFPRKGSVLEQVGSISGASRIGDRVSPAAPATAGANGVIYGLAANDDLLWYRHLGRDTGTFTWAAPTAQTVGTGWNFPHLFSGGDGVIYAVSQTGDLLWYRHDGRTDGTFRWAASDGKKVGTGWNVKQVFAAGGGVIYAITETGDLIWNRHDGRGDGTFRWAAPEGKKVGTGWNFQQVFAGDNGVIYAITDGGDLLWYRHDGRADGTFRWAAPEGKKVGTGWNAKHAFSGANGVIYAINANDELIWNRHDGRGDGTFRWAAPTGKKVGTGWSFRQIFSGESLAP